MIALAVLVASCATGRSYARGDAAGKAGDWEAAVGFYRQAVQDDPDRPDYKIALERAMLQAAAMFVDRAKQFEAAGQPEEALRAYRKAQEFEPANRQVATWAGDLERSIRDKLEAAAVRPEIDKLREQARRASAEPLLNPASRDLLGVHFTNAGIRDVLNFIGASTGINVTYDRDFQDRSITVNLEGVTLEQALQQIMVANVLFYKVLNERTIIVAADTTQKRTQYEEQVIRTFFISHSDATELSQLLVAVVRVAGMAIQPQIVANKTSNTVTVRATGPVVQIIERLIEVNDKPRAEIMVDVQILEVSRERTKKYGLNLSNYQISGAFSPESTPDKTTPFNLNTISKGVSTADFYMALPTAIVNFLESDSQTKVLAKPNIRASEGQKVALNLGEDVPIPSTTFTPIATGGPSTNPLVSFGYRTIGIIVEMEPRVTYEGDIILNVSIENSARGSDSNIAGQNLPSFFSRKVQTRLRLRDGESNLLAGLLRDDERKSLNGFPGVMRLPIVKQLFSNNDNTIKQTDIVMLITPRIIRTHELKALDLSPIYIGTQANMALGGPPPLIGGDAAAAAAPGLTPGVAPSPALSPAGIPAAVPAPAGTQPPTTPALPAGSSARPTIPPGSSPIPGMVGVPPAQPAAAPNPITVFSPPEPPPPAPTPAPAPATAQPAPAAPAAPVAPPQAPPGAAPPAPAPAAPVVGTARVTLSPPSEMRVGSGPYTIPVSVTGASRMSTITLSITYNPTLVRVRSVQEGTFMRQGGVTPAFTSQTDDKAGRIDIAVTRPGDQTGASTSGLLAAILLEPLAPGTGSLTVTGTAAIPGGTPAGLQFAPATITVK